MIDKQEFYHGAAVIKLIADPRFRTISPQEGGYVVNGKTFVLIKYSTRHNSPWRFTVTQDEVVQVTSRAFSNSSLIVLVCGGDGICAVTWENASGLLGDGFGWLSTKRKFNGSYTISGPLGSLKRKVPVKQWPSILFEGEQ